MTPDMLPMPIPMTKEEARAHVERIDDAIRALQIQADQHRRGIGFGPVGRKLLDHAWDLKRVRDALAKVAA